MPKHTKSIGRIALALSIALFSGVNLLANASQQADHLLFINSPDTRTSNPVIPDASASVRSATGSAPALVFAWNARIQSPYKQVVAQLYSV